MLIIQGQRVVFVMHRTLLNALCRSYSNINSTSVKRKTKSKALEKGNIVKKYNVENKRLFGDLVETAQQRKKKLRASEADVVTVENDKSRNKDHGSELWWWDKSPHVTHIKFKNHEQVKTDSRSKLSTESGTLKVCDDHYGISTSEKILTSNVSHEESASPMETVQENILILRENSNVDRTSLRLPPIIVKNIATFPLENYEKGSTGWAPVTEIMSLNVESEIESKKKSILTYPSVTKILSATMSEASLLALQKWKDKMIAELGEEGFQEYQQGFQSPAQNSSPSKTFIETFPTNVPPGLLAAGTMLHNTIHRFLSGLPADKLFVDPVVEGCWRSLENVIRNISDVKVLESHVVHPQLMYRGFLDCIAKYKGKPLLIEWKKSDKQKPYLWNTYDAPLQAAAYLGALNFDDNYNFKVRNVLVVVAYTDGSPAHVHKLGVAECQRYWRAWLERLRKYWSLNQSDSTTQG